MPISLLIPGLALAQLTSTTSLIEKIGDLVRTLIIVVAGIAVLVFFWGLTKFILAAGSEVDKEKGKNLMIWGTIALFVMVSIWGIIYFIGNELFPGISDYSAPDFKDIVPSR